MTTTLSQWLAALDALPLECDGLTRVISTLMNRDGVAHQAYVGSLSVADVGVIPVHWWIKLSDGQICDYRARIWLGNSDRVPHGIFLPEDHHRYEARAEARTTIAPVVFQLLAGMPLSDFPRLGN